MKKLIYYVLTCAITVSHSPIVRAADVDSDLALDELKTCHSIISRAASSSSDKLNQECSSSVDTLQEGERHGKLYIKQSRLHEIIFSPPGEYEAQGLPDLVANGYKYVRFENEKGEEEIYLFLSSFEKKYKSRFPKDEKLISCPIVGIFPQTPAWAVEVDLPPKKKPSNKKSSRRKHRSKRTKE